MRQVSLSKTILRGTSDGGQQHGQQRKCWMDNVKRMDIPAYARTANDGLLQKSLEKDLCCINLHAPPPPQHPNNSALM